MRLLTYFAVAIAIFLAACGEQQREVPENLIPKDKFAEILTDIHLSDAYLEGKGFSDFQISKDSASYYTYVYKKHNITRGQFVESLTYYTDEPAELDEIYLEVMASLTELQEKHKENK